MRSSLRALSVGLVTAATGVAPFATPAVAQTISSAANQTFAVGQAATAMSTITITEDASPLITSANDIRIRIPAGFNMTWNTGITTATIGGSDAGKVSTTVTYENGGQVLRINATSNFAANDQITISGLQFNNFTALSAAANLELVISGAAGGPTVATDDKTKAIVAPTLSSAANQVFTVGDAATAMSAATVTEAASATITSANDIRLRIPAGFNMTWNPAVTTATITGSGAAKVSTAVTYENSNQVLRLNVTANFVAGDQIVVSGLQFNNFTAASAASTMELVINGAAGGTATGTDDKTKIIAVPTFTEPANQIFTVGDPATAMSTATITDAATSATITAANGIRLRIPAALNMVWNTGVTAATIGGAAAAKVSSVVSYEDAGKTLVLSVSLDFAAGDQITVAGPQFTSFTGVSAATALQLVVSGAGGGTAATSNRTKQIVQPAIVSAANQTFTVGDPVVSMSTITITDNALPTISAVRDIRVRIPAGFNMTWNTALTTATIGGTSAAKVSPTVTYEDAGQTLVLNVTADFTASNVITVAGLQFNNFSAASAANNLQLVVSGTGGGTAAIDTRTIRIYPPLSISSAADQIFGVSQASTANSTITITEDGTPTITSANKLRVRIPAGFNMTWNTGVGTATLGGSAAGKVQTTATYENGGQVLFLNVLTSFVAGDVLTISGLQFNNFNGASAADNLELVVAGGAAGPTAAEDDKTKTVLAPVVSSAANQVFTVGDAATTISAITVTDNATLATITAVNDIRLRIPTGFNMTWNTALTTATITGSAAAKVSTTVTYENAGQVLRLNVSANFVAGDQIVVSGLQFNNFTAPSAASSLQLVNSGAAGGATAATDDKSKTIVAPVLTEAGNQIFTVGDPSTAMTTATITDAASSPTITAANDIRLRIPAALNMIWNTAITTATIGGAASAKVSPAVSYEDAGKTLVLNVVADFAAGDQITVAGPAFTSFSAVSAATPLQVVVSGSGGGTAATSSATKQIYAALSISSAANLMYNIGMGAHNIGTITVRGDASSQINTVNDIRIRIPSGLNMTWNTADVTATIGGAASAKVSTTVSYEDAGKTLVLAVVTNFAPGDQITVGGLQFNNFTAISAAQNLELVTGGAGGATATTDDKTVAIIVAYGITSVANQIFTVAQAAAAMSAVTVTDSATTPSITAGNNLRFRIPAGFNMTWNPAITTATYGGSAAGKVSTAVTYESGNTVLSLNVITNFVAGDQLVVSGLQFANFTAVSAADALEMVVSGSSGGPTAATDDKTKTIVAPVLTGAANQLFSVGDPATAMTTATVTDATTSPTITAAGDIRLRIPAALNMIWNTGTTTATIGGAAASKVSTTVTYEDAGKTLVLNVTSDFAASDQITVSGPEFTSFTAVSAATALQLVVSGSGGGTAATSTTTKQIYASLSISSAANLAYNVGMGAHNIGTITVRGDASSQINTANDIRIRIPAGLSMTWNTADVTATIGGAAAAKVSTTVSYEDTGRTLVLAVVTNFAPGDQITVGGLQFDNFTAISAAHSLELVTGGGGGATAATDDKTVSIIAAFGISSAANQTFIVAQAATAMSAITVTDSATTPRVTSANDIRIRIPAALNMTWNSAITTATITGPAAAKVSTTVTYESGNKVLRVNATANFAAGDQITISGLQFNNFTAASSATNLEFVVSGASGGPTVATDDKTKTIFSYGALVSPATTTASRLPSNGTNYTVLFTVQNTGTTTDSYDLLVTRSPGTAVTTVSMTGTGVTQGANPDSARLSGVASTASVQITVTYSVANVAAGATDALTMTARSVSDPTKSSNGRLDLTVVKPNMTVSRTRSPLGAQPPGTEITHTITITNAGTAAADGLIVADSLGSNSDFKVGSVLTNLPGGISVAVEYSNDGGSSWTYSPASASCGAAAGFDGCVNRVRWRLLSSLSSTPPNHTGNVQFISRIR